MVDGTMTRPAYKSDNPVRVVHTWSWDEKKVSDTQKSQRMKTRHKRDPPIASSRKYFTKQEMSDILQSLYRLEDIALAKIGLDLGARGGEIVNLRWEDFDYPNHVVHIWDEKKDFDRFCCMSESTWKVFREYEKVIDKRRQRRVFPFSLRTANRRIKTWAKTVGVTRHVRWHMLRHTHVMLSREAGRDWNWICQQTGNSLIGLIRNYGLLSMDDRVKMANDHPIYPENIHTREVTK